MELSPRLPANDIQGTYPFITLWKDHAIVRFGCSDRAFRGVDPMGNRNDDRPLEEREGHNASVQIALPLSWFYEGLARFG